MSAALLPSCDRAIAQARPASAAPPPEGPPPAGSPRMVIATTVLASSLAFIDGSVVNVGLPSIARSFPDPAVSLSWVVSAYLLPLSALLLLGGAAGDRFGQRRLLSIGIGLFLGGSLGCAVAPGLAGLLAGRVVQGIGAALLMPTSLAVLGRSFDGAARGRAIGLWAAAGAAAGALGPLVGGGLIDTLGWRAMFLLNLPIGIAALALAARYTANRPDAGKAPLDLAGAALATAGLGVATWGLTLGSGAAGWSGMAVGAALLAVFVRVEKARAAAAMMPLALFASRAFVGLSGATFLLYGALGGLLLLLPYVLIDLAGYSATAAGAALLPMPLVIAVTAPTMGRLAARRGPRLPLTVGPAVVAVGFLMAMRVGAGGSYWSATLPAMLLISFGMAGAVAPLTTAVLASVDTPHAGVASGFNSAIARTGGLIATALASAILIAHGPALAASFRWAMACGAGVAAAASACAWWWLREGSGSNARPA